MSARISWSPMAKKKEKHVGRRPLRPDGTGAEGSTLQKDKIVEQVALQIAEGTWQPYKSVRELAAKLGVSLHAAQGYASEATRLLRMSWGQDDAKVAVLERIAQLGRSALERTEEVLDMSGNVHTLKKPDHRTALAAAKHLADCLGLSGSNSEVVVRYQQMSDSELLREVKELALQQKGNPHGIIEAIGQEVSEPEPAPIRPNPTPGPDAATLARINAEDASRRWRSRL